MWRAREASRAMSPISLSRISPIMMTSGSAYRNAHLPVAKVRPIFGGTWTWRRPFWVNSTGSLAALIFRSSVSRCLSLACTVAQCCVVTQKHGRGVGLCTGRERGRTPETHFAILATGIRPKRYRASASMQGQEDLDTNRGAAGQKTGRGGLLTQGRGQRGYSRHA
jgi:hypothetical protein